MKAAEALKSLQEFVEQNGDYAKAKRHHSDRVHRSLKKETSVEEDDKGR